MSASRPFAFAHITDVHVGRTPDSGAWLAEDLRQIESEAGDRVAFIAAAGQRSTRLDRRE